MKIILLILDFNPVQVQVNKHEINSVDSGF